MSKKQLTITLTEEDYTALKEQADKNYRTLSQEINYRLHKSLNQYTPDTLLFYPPGVKEIPPHTSTKLKEPTPPCTVTFNK